MSRKLLVALIAVALVAPGVMTSLSDAQERPAKKLIEYGWDVPYPDFVLKHIKDMEKRPFDGIMFRTRGFDHAFDTTPWKLSAFQPQIDTLATIQWGKFTDNFLTLYAANQWKMNWYDDAQWKTITANLKLVSKALKAGRCVGVVFDPEPYGENPWLYPGKFTDKSFEEVQAQVRKRGAQFMTALQTDMPNLKVLNFFQLALFQPAADEPDPRLRAEIQTTKPWHNFLALMPAFFLGMLDAAGPGAVIIDGNEQSYYYESPADYYREYHLMKQRVKVFVPRALWKKYDSQVQAGMALYVDQALGMRGNTKTAGSYLSPADRLKFFENNVYYSLTTADEYVWCYSEKMSWWQNYTPSAGEPAPDVNALPEGLEAAVTSALQKYRRGEPLGFDVQEMITTAREKMKADGK